MSDTNWRTWFCKGESCYRACFRAGRNGISWEDLHAHLELLGVEWRNPKDYQSWVDGHWHWKMRQGTSFEPVSPIEFVPSLTSQPDLVLSDFDRWPTGWRETNVRWFPCNEDNMPMQKWGYLPDFKPNLYTRDDAIALSPIGWVGQNLYAQPFIVIDIDGEGHGEHDQQVIDFGNQFRNMTEVWSSPEKPGSFHLYFDTPYQIPIAHFAFAKLDIMGNQKNAAVYTKDKFSNEHERALLTDDIWEELKRYIAIRKEQRDSEALATERNMYDAL